jgi:hypothetical protein
MLLFVLLAFLLGGGNAQFTIQSSFLSQFERAGTQGNLTRWSKRTLTFECSDTNFRDTSLTVQTQDRNYYYDVLCEPPLYSFEVVNRLFVPRMRRMVVAEICLVNSIADAGNSSDLTGRGASARRRLLSLNPDDPVEAGFERTSIFDMDPQATWAERMHGTRFENVPRGPTSPDSIPKNGRKLLFLPFVALAAGFVLGNKDVQCWLKDNVGLGLCNRDEPPPLSEAQINQLLADQRFALAVKKFNQAQFELLEDQLNGFNVAAQEQLAKQAAQLGTLEKYSSTLNESIYTLANNTQAFRDETLLKFGNVYNNIQAGVNISQAISDRAAQFENATNINFQRLINITQDIVRQMNDNEFFNVKKHTDNSLNTRKDTGNLYRMFVRQQAKRLLAEKFHALKNQMRAEGLYEFLHPEFGGFEPSASTPDSRKLLVDQQMFNFINTTEGGHPLGAGIDVAHNFVVQLWCSFEPVINEATRIVLYTDFLQLIGPKNCTNQAGEAVDNCRCWVEVTHLECRAKNPPVSFATKTGDNREAYKLQVSDNLCAVNPPITGFAQYSGSWNNRKIDTIAEWHLLLGSLCSVQLSISVPQDPGTYPRNNFHLVSSRYGTMEYDTRPSVFPEKAFVCRPDLDFVFIRNQNGGPNLVHSVYTFWTLGYKALVNEQTVYERQRYGLLPNYLTYEVIPFQYLENNQTYECTRASWIAVSRDTRPVYTVRSTGINPLVTSNAYLEPPVCGIFGCTFGTPVTTEQTADVQSTASFENLLPDSSKTIVGDLWTPANSATPMTQVFDIPAGAAPVTTAVFDRENKVTYVWQPIPTGYFISNYTSYNNLNAPLSLGGPYPDATYLDQWLLNNGGTFNSLQGRYSPDIHLTDFVSGRCVLPADVPIQWLCEMFDHWALHATTDMRKGRLVLRPKQWRYEVTLGIVDGEVIQRVFDGCPDFRYITYSDGFQELELVNSLPVPLRVRVQVQYLTGSCSPEGATTYSLQPRQTVRRNIQACGQQLITVSKIIEGETLVQCEQPLNVTYDPTASTNVKRFVVDRLNRSYVKDEAYEAFAQSQINAVAIFQQLLQYSRLDINPELTTLERNDLVNTLIKNYVAALNASAAEAITSNVPTATSAIAPLIDRVNEIALEFATRQIAIDQGNANLLNITNALILQFRTNFTDAFNELNDATDAKVKANQDLIDAIRNSQDNSPQCKWFSCSSFGFLSFLCPIFCWILNAAIYVTIGIVGLILLKRFAPGLLKSCWNATCKAAAESPQQQPPQAPGGPPPAGYGQFQYPPQYNMPPPPATTANGPNMQGQFTLRSSQRGEEESRPLISSSNRVMLQDEDDKKKASEGESSGSETEEIELE